MRSVNHLALDGPLVSATAHRPHVRRLKPTNLTSMDRPLAARRRGCQRALIDEVGAQAGTHSDAQVLVGALSALLLASSSATAALWTWCEEHGLAAGEITAVRHSQAGAPYADDDVLDELRPGPGESVQHRRVDLARGGLVLSRADNWYLPDRLPLAMRHTLENTDAPFGKVVAPLRPSRRTFFVEFLSVSRALLVHSRSQPHRSPDAGEDEPDEVLEHRAVVLKEEGCPIAVVRERYRSVLVAFAV